VNPVSTNLHALAQDGHRLGRPTASGSLTYEPYFGLKEKAFSLSSDPRFLYRSPTHAPAFDQLLAGIRRREGLIVLSGEIGTGKTTLCRAVLEHLDRRTFSTFVPDPFVSREDLLKMLLVDFGVMSVDDVKSGRLRNASRAELSYPLYEFLNSLVPLQAFAVLVIDEAQNLPLPLLEEIRILSDLEGREKLLQVVLIGQPELKSNLKLPQMRQVDQRVSVRCELAPLKRAEVHGYVDWRLNVASAGNPNGVQFTLPALDVVHRASAGVPRLINRICDAALHQGYSCEVTTIEVGHVANALKYLVIDDALVEPSAAETPVVATEPEPTVDRSVWFEPAPTEPDPAAPRLVSNAVAEFTSEAARPMRTGTAFPLRKSWRDRIGRRPQPIAMLALTGMVLCAATIAASSWYRLEPETPQAREVTLPNVPAQPRLARASGFAVTPPDTSAVAAAPSAPTARYIIQVASFEDEARASQLVSELAAAGYRAYHSRFALDGEPWWQVSVGPYATVADGESDLMKVREIPGYDDATLRSIARQ
jgi:type II secretory pathway predicted ATPase ExeA/cell division septation protein DedD